MWIATHFINWQMSNQLHCVNGFSCILHVVKWNTQTYWPPKSSDIATLQVGGSNLMVGFRCTSWCSWQTDQGVYYSKYSPSKCQGLPRLPASGEMSLFSDSNMKWGAGWVRLGRTRGNGVQKPRQNVEVCHPKAECTCKNPRRHSLLWVDC